MDRIADPLTVIVGQRFQPCQSPIEILPDPRDGQTHCFPFLVHRSSPMMATAAALTLRRHYVVTYPNVTLEIPTDSSRLNRSASRAISPTNGENDGQRRCPANDDAQSGAQSVVTSNAGGTLLTIE